MDMDDQTKSPRYSSGGACRNQVDCECAMQIAAQIAGSIQQERTRLGHAGAILRCLAVAAAYDDEIDGSSAGVAEVAHRLIQESIDRLDPAALFQVNDRAVQRGGST